MSGRSSLSPRAREIVAAARGLLERDGPSGVSMRRIAAELGLRAPSLYEHLPDKRALEFAMISEAFWEQGDLTIAAAARARENGEDPLRAIAETFRGWALAHPHAYRLMADTPMDRSQIEPGAEAHGGVALREYCRGDLTRARMLWAFAHGMIMHEINDRVGVGAGPDADAIREAGLAALRP